MGRQWGQDHKVWIVENAVRQLDWSPLCATYSNRGSRPYRPDLMLRLALYEILRGVASPNRWAQDAKENLPLRWLLRGIQPSARVCYRFRDRVGNVVETIHELTIKGGQQEGLFEPPKEMAQDGSLHRACASRHRLVNKDQLEKRRHVLQEAMGADAECREPAEPKPYWLPNTPNGRADLMSRMEKAEEVLAERLKKNAEKQKSDRLAEKHVCVSLSDPEAAISRDKEKVFSPLYNVQYMTDYQSGLVFGFDVNASATDVGTLIPMIDKVQPLVDHSVERVVTDSTYATVLDLQACKDRNIDLIALVQENSWTEKNRERKGKARTSNKRDFIWLEGEKTYQCPAGHRLRYQYKETASRAGGKVTLYRYHCPPEHCTVCPLAHSCAKDPSRGRTIKRLEGQELVDAQRERMKQPDAQKLHRNRGAVVERSIADTKEHRDGRRLHGRGLLRATAEIGLKIIAQNILTLHRLRTGKNATAALLLLTVGLFVATLASPEVLAAGQEDVPPSANVCRENAATEKVYSSPGHRGESVINTPYRSRIAGITTSPRPRGRPPDGHRKPCPPGGLKAAKPPCPVGEGGRRLATSPSRRRSSRHARISAGGLPRPK